MGLRRLLVVDLFGFAGLFVVLFLFLLLIILLLTPFLLFLNNLLALELGLDFLLVLNYNLFRLADIELLTQIVAEDP